MAKYIIAPRVMDDGNVAFDADSVTMICDNANESGIVEGTCAVYLKNGPAFALNVPFDYVAKALESEGHTLVDYRPAKEESVN